MQKRVTFVVFERMEGLFNAYASWFGATDRIFMFDGFHGLICAKKLFNIIEVNIYEHRNHFSSKRPLTN
jgi:hypothetical protein